MKSLIKKYNHIWVIIYAAIYAPWFMWLENNVTTDYHVIHSPIDDKIPFCEYFIIPYYMWFFFVGAVFIYEFFYSKKEFYQTCALMFTGMTFFLILCTVWHNGINLREDIVLNDNFCSKLVEGLHKADTSTNVFPSLHVFNTLGCLIALYTSRGLKNKPVIKILATILGIAIILATMFLKQHSIIDVIGAFVLAAVLYMIFYLPKWKVFSDK